MGLSEPLPMQKDRSRPQWTHYLRLNDLESVIEAVLCIPRGEPEACLDAYRRYHFLVGDRWIQLKELLDL